MMRAHGVERAFTFPLNDPDRHPAYRVPNDRVHGSGPRRRRGCSSRSAGST